MCRRDGRVAEGARLESVYTLTGIVGSNPTLSARGSPFGSFELRREPCTLEFTVVWQNCAHASTRRHKEGLPS
jgi:hypothetical protein